MIATSHVGGKKPTVVSHARGKSPTTTSQAECTNNVEKSKKIGNKPKFYCKLCMGNNLIHNCPHVKEDSQLLEHNVVSQQKPQGAS